MLTCGVDEVGRGPLAGPVCASAVIFSSQNIDISLLNDSKKMTEKSRLKAFYELTSKAYYAIGWASNVEIDELNILQATLLAMRRAFTMLYNELSKSNASYLERLKVIVDGNINPNFREDVDCEPLIKADSIVPEVMAASIIAKVARDKMMCRYSYLYPEWGYEKHKGYGTKAHIEAIKKYGASPIQRMTFKSELYQK
ncbi:MAG: ribonuclease HII [Treponema sp.]